MTSKIWSPSEKLMVTPDMIEKATRRDKGKYNDKSFMDGKGNFPGFLGEYIVGEYRPDWRHILDSYDFDFIMANGQSVDIKTKYTTSDSPRGSWMASVCKDSEHQRVDYYVFVRVFKDPNGDYPFGRIYGAITKAEFMEKATFYKKGEPEGDNGYAVKQDCWSLPYEQMQLPRQTRRDD